MSVQMEFYYIMTKYSTLKKIKATLCIYIIIKIYNLLLVYITQYENTQ